MLQEGIINLADKWHYITMIWKNSQRHSKLFSMRRPGTYGNTSSNTTKETKTDHEIIKIKVKKSKKLKKEKIYIYIHIYIIVKTT